MGARVFHERSPVITWMTLCSRYAGIVNIADPERVTCPVCIAHRPGRFTAER